MLNLEREIASLAKAGAIPPQEAAALIARERREIFSIHPELRGLSWIGAIFLATGAGIVLAQNLDRIGPVVLASVVALAAAGAYGYAVWRRRSSRVSLVDDYILLLGALLLSADLAYVEGQFHLLDHGWPRHLLLLAIIHGTTAYFFESRMLLSLSLTALAAWMGIEQRVETIFDSSTETALRAFACAAAVLLWRVGHSRWGASQPFERVFEHFAANLALAGSLILTFHEGTRWIGIVITVVLAVVVIRYGFMARAETFVIYAYVYGVIAIVVGAVDFIDGETGKAGMFFTILVLAIAGLFRLHDMFKKRSA